MELLNIHEDDSETPSWIDDVTMTSSSGRAKTGASRDRYECRRHQRAPNMAVSIYLNNAVKMSLEMLSDANMGYYRCTPVSRRSSCDVHILWLNGITMATGLVH